MDGSRPTSHLFVIVSDSYLSENSAEGLIQSIPKSCSPQVFRDLSFWPILQRMEEVDYLTFVAEGIHRRGLAAPAVFLLESSKPLSGLGRELVSTLRPILTCVVGVKHVDGVLAILQGQESVEALIARLEQIQASIAKG